MTIYRVIYRTARAIDDDGNEIGDPGPWTAGPEIDVSGLPASFTLAGLANGTTYEFAAGRDVNGALNPRSNIQRATPVLGTARYDSIGPQTIRTGGLEQFDRQATMTTLTMSNASWIHVYLDWGAQSAGVARGNKPLPAVYPENSDVIRRSENTVVEILLSSLTAFTFRVVTNNASVTITLSAVA